MPVQIFLLFSLGLIGLSCSEPQGNTVPSAASDDLKESETTPSSAKLNTLKYSASTHSVEMNIEYQGCRKTQHSLSYSACSEAFPQQCSATLIRPKNFDDSCEILIHETLVFPLSNSLDTALLSVKTTAGAPLQVLIDRKGVIPAP